MTHFTYVSFRQLKAIPKDKIKTVCVQGMGGKCRNSPAGVPMTILAAVLFISLSSASWGMDLKPGDRVELSKNYHVTIHPESSKSCDLAKGAKLTVVNPASSSSSKPFIMVKYRGALLAHGGVCGSGKYNLFSDDVIGIFCNERAECRKEKERDAEKKKKHQRQFEEDSEIVKNKKPALLEGNRTGEEVSISDATWVTAFSNEDTCLVAPSGRATVLGFTADQKNAVIKYSSVVPARGTQCDPNAAFYEVNLKDLQRWKSETTPPSRVDAMSGEGTSIPPGSAQ